ncbi:MAG: MBL fold metallo-hydrolase [Anaerolineales bacterium]|nr:MBL fold metallo-hydrolase [Anaerolineales bacterium]
MSASPDFLERLRRLMPGEAVHIGHSFIVLNVAGVRLALDPATENGECAAPFSNLTLTARTRLLSYRPLVEPAHVPSAEQLAECVDVVLYSHTHADHFNAAVLAKMMAANPRLRVFWPAGTPRLLYAPRRRLSRVWNRLLAWLDTFTWADRVPAGLREFSNAVPPRLRLANTRELADGQMVVLREAPRIELHAFEVRHPRPLLWVRSPFEAATPPVLGYEIVFEAEGARRRLLLVGETGADPEVLHRIWAAGDELVGLFLPVDERLRLPIIRALYEWYFHASPHFLALAERLAGDRATIHGLHHGLWLYTLNADDVAVGRRLLQRSRHAPRAAEAEVGARLAESRAARNFGLTAMRRLERLIDAISRYPQRANDKVRLNPLGQPFRFGQAG